MLTSLAFLCWMMAPLEYIPFLDTFNELCDRAYTQSQTFFHTSYDGDVLPVFHEALVGEMDRVYAIVIKDLTLDLEALKKELGSSLSAIQIQALYAFRQKECQRLEKEHAAWMDLKSAYADYVYSTFGSGSGRLTYPIASSNAWVIKRIKELKQQYRGILSSFLQCKHLSGTWKKIEGEAFFHFDRIKDQRNHENSLVAEEILTDSADLYEVKKGCLILLSDGKPSRAFDIDIVEEGNSLYLEIYHDSVKISLPDLWLEQIVEKRLMQELQRIYQERISGLKERMEEMKRENIEWRNDLILELQSELEDLQKAQAAWENWVKVCYAEREQILPNGTCLPHYFLSQKNRAYYDWILDLQNAGAFPSSYNPTIENDILFGEWKSEERQEVWLFFKENENDCYRIIKDNKVIEHGIYSFDREGVHLHPVMISSPEKFSLERVQAQRFNERMNIDPFTIAKSRRFSRSSHVNVFLDNGMHPRKLEPRQIHLSEAESKIWFKYLFGSLELKNRYVKVSPYPY